MKKITMQGMTFGRLILGTGGFLLPEKAEEYFRLLDAFVEGGGTMVDCGRVYGEAEAVLGEYVRRTGADIQIITKGAHHHYATPDVPRVKAECIREDVAISLDKLGRPFDLYFLHRDDPTYPVGPLMDTFDDLHREGICHHFGVSNWSVDRIAEANDYARERGIAPLCASQVQHAFALHNDVPSRWPGCTRLMPGEEDFYLGEDMVVFAYSSQAGGYFDKLASGNPVREDLVHFFGNDTNARRLEALKPIAAKHGTNVGAVALNYLMSQELPVAAIVGAHTVEQVKACLAAEALALDAEDMAALAML